MKLWSPSLYELPSILYSNRLRPSFEHGRCRFHTPLQPRSYSEDGLAFNTGIGLYSCSAAFNVRLKVSSGVGSSSSLVLP
eukprot:7892960-Pyramimonas_sp.AAC.1